MFPNSIRVSSLRAAWLAASCVVLASGLAGCSFDPPELERPQDPPNASPIAGCGLDCHGDGDNPAPPNNLEGETGTMLRSVGAHRQHLDPAPTWHQAVECGACHSVPSEVEAPGHMDGDNIAEVIFGGLAVEDGSAPSWNGTTCADAYCHGSTLQGGTATEPNWTTVDGRQVECGSCHGLPPPNAHDPGDTNCGSCHPTIDLADPMTFLNPGSHIDGNVDVVEGDQACNSCHGSPTSSAPPNDLDGNNNTGSPGVGAHTAHLNVDLTLYRKVTCVECHTVPLTADAPGHRDGDNQAELRFSGLNPEAVYDFGEARCQNLYCHGDGKGSNGEVRWINPESLVCGDCHAVEQSYGDDDNNQGLSGRHDFHLGQSGIDCNDCHGGVIDGNRNMIQPSMHINGVHDVQLSDPEGTWNPAEKTCRARGCHGNNRADPWYGSSGDDDS